MVDLTQGFFLALMRLRPLFQAPPIRLLLLEM
jgi:hypothetical protein